MKALLVSVLHLARVFSSSLYEPDELFDLRTPAYYSAREEALSEPFSSPKMCPEQFSTFIEGLLKGPLLYTDNNINVFLGEFEDTEDFVLIKEGPIASEVDALQCLDEREGANVVLELQDSNQSSLIVDFPKGHFLRELLIVRTPSTIQRDDIMKTLIGFVADLHDMKKCLGGLRAEDVLITDSGSIKVVNLSRVRDLDESCNDIDDLTALSVQMTGVEGRRSKSLVALSLHIDTSGQLLFNLQRSNDFIVSPNYIDLLDDEDYSIRSYYASCVANDSRISLFSVTEEVTRGTFLARHLTWSEFQQDLLRPATLISREDGEYLAIIFKHKRGNFPLSLYELVERATLLLYSIHVNGHCHGSAGSSAFFYNANGLFLTSFGEHPMNSSCSDIKEIGSLMKDYYGCGDMSAAECIKLMDEWGEKFFAITQNEHSTIHDAMRLLKLELMSMVTMNTMRIMNLREEGMVPLKGGELPSNHEISVIILENGEKRLLKMYSAAEDLMLRRLPNHKNVMQSFGVGEKGRKVLQLEYIDGNDLLFLLQTGSPNMPCLFALSKQLLDGLGALHEAGLCHNDFHSRNIRISYEGIAKIIDFDKSKIMMDLLEKSKLKCTDMAFFGNTFLYPRGFLSGTRVLNFKQYLHTNEPRVLHRIMRTAFAHYSSTILRDSDIFGSIDERLSQDLVKHYVTNAEVYGINELYTLPLNCRGSFAICAQYPDSLHIPQPYIEGSEISHARGHYLAKIVHSKQYPLLPEVRKFVIDLLSVVRELRSRNICHGRISEKQVFIRANKTRDMILMRFYPSISRMDKCADLEDGKKVVETLIQSLPDRHSSVDKFMNVLRGTSDIDVLIEQALQLEDIPKKVHKCEHILNSIIDDMNENPLNVLDSRFADFEECISEDDLDKDAVTVYQDMLIQISDLYFEDPNNMTEDTFTQKNADFARILLKYQNSALRRSQ